MSEAERIETKQPLQKQSNQKIIHPDLSLK